MKLTGSYTNRLGQEISIEISDGVDSNVHTLGDEDFGLSDDPIEIETSVNDNFDVLVKSSATITIVTRNFEPDFFAKSYRDVTAVIKRDNEVIFSGYIVPMSLSQDFVEVYEDMELNCVDYLSTLENYNYKGAGTTESYELAKAGAEQRSFADIIKEILGTENVYFDQSKSYSTKDVCREIFTKTIISDLLFFGDEEDDVWTQEEVLEAILRYFDLHIVQIGDSFYIFSWATIKEDADSIEFINLFTGETKTVSRATTTITDSVSANSDASISMDEIYNQIKVKCSLEPIEDIIEPPLEESSLTSPFPTKQLYMREYWSDGEGKKAIRAFFNMINGTAGDYEEAGTTDWYVHVKNNTKWTFGTAGSDIITQLCSDGTNQQSLPNWLASNIGAAILSLGSVKKQYSTNNNSPTSKVDMSNYLVVSVNGNGLDGEDVSKPTVSELQAAIPVATYKGNVAGGNFSPQDERTTNYIVISGSIIMNPIMNKTDDYSNLKKYDDESSFTTKYWHKTVPSRNNNDGRYYSQQFFKATSPKDEVSYDADTQSGFCPFTNEGPQEYEFKYSAIGDSTDTISKVSVLQCMLIIGDKCVVETGTDGQTSDFAWQTYKTREECADDDEYYQQSFAIGFNPKIGDKLIGTEFSIQNNIDYTMGLDEEGMAIPIKMSDHISGKVTFIILGPVNSMWSDITRRHPTMFRHTKWTENSVLLLAHTSSILVKSFEIKVTSDNGMNDISDDDSDVVYVSDTDEAFINKKEVDFKINSALTSDECAAVGVKNQVSLSTPLNADTKNGIMSLTDLKSGNTSKPEQLYVDSYYNDWHKPRIGLELTVIDNNTSFFDRYQHPALEGKKLYTTSLIRHTNDGEAELKLRERNDD